MLFRIQQWPLSNVWQSNRPGLFVVRENIVAYVRRMFIFLFIFFLFTTLQTLNYLIESQSRFQHYIIYTKHLDWVGGLKKCPFYNNYFRSCLRIIIINQCSEWLLFVRFPKALYVISMNIADSCVWKEKH